jgi:hypothetical protein
MTNLNFVFGQKNPMPFSTASTPDTWKILTAV